jgi:hypothetical protein
VIFPVSSVSEVARREDFSLSREGDPVKMDPVIEVEEPSGHKKAVARLSSSSGQAAHQRRSRP